MIVDVSAEDRELLERFYRDLYLPEFAAQREPLEAWLAALDGEGGYRMFVRVVLDGDAILGGVTYELYPESGCGFVTYMVVTREARRRGFGRRLLFGASEHLVELGARAVLGEVNDPRLGSRLGGEWERLERFQRWGARVLDVRYVQPALGPGLERDRGLVLIALPPTAAELDGEVLRRFVRELHAVTERCEPDAEVSGILASIPERVACIVVSPGHGHADRER
jgi:GNAT superfamily N-acetyltransferase